MLSWWWWWQNKKEVTICADTTSSSFMPLITIPEIPPEFSHPCPSNGYYDVFLCFRDEDTRYGFTSSLYRSLRENKVYTFMDLDPTGEDIDYLFKMVGKSKMAVVIYSERFASSVRRLRELEMILQRMKEKKMLIIPIFHNVDVHDLKHLSGKTVEYLDKHIPKYGETAVEKWKKVVTDLSKVNGLTYKDSTNMRYEYDFISDVINAINEKLEECEETLEIDIINPNSKDVRKRDKILERPTVKITGFMKGLGLVTSIDSHSTKPWVLLFLLDGSICIWDYKTRTEEKSFKVTDSLVLSAKFVQKKHWIVVGSDNGFVHVVDYNNSEKLKEFEAHEDIIQCIVVHPNSPYILTTSNDKLIKLWNWEDDWACWETFEGHSSCVTHASFNTRDSSSFASASNDGTIKIWSLYSSVAKFTINAHDLEVNCVEYFIGNNNKLYLLSGGSDWSIRIWDYESKNLVEYLQGDTRQTWITLVHSNLPFILTSSSNNIIRIWNKNTHQHMLEWKNNYGEIFSLGFIKASEEVVIGCVKGVLVIKIVYPETRPAFRLLKRLLML